MNKTCIIIAGPTAVGKTALAIELAQYFNTSVISADSRQCYKELNIGVAKPSLQQLETVPHYFINSHSVQDSVTAVDYENYALCVTDKLFETNDVIIVVGGTGLYIKAFVEGLDEIPAVDGKLRSGIIQQYEQNGIAWLRAEIQHKDPLFFLEGEIQNPHRLMRALEVFESTGKSIVEFQRGNKKKRAFDIHKVLVNLPREDLYDRINTRVDTMMEDGLLHEVKSLEAFKHLNALQTVGYTEMFDHLEGKISLEQAIDSIKKNTRHYAKRQLTWFKKNNDFIEVDAKLGSILSVLKFNT